MNTYLIEFESILWEDIKGKIIEKAIAVAPNEDAAWAMLLSNIGKYEVVNKRRIDIVPPMRLFFVTHEPK